MNPTVPNHPGCGHVTFLGAGPGDPGLLTLRAVEALATADVLIADPQVLDVVRGHVRPGVAADAQGAPRQADTDGSSATATIPVLRDTANLVMTAARGGKRVVRAVAGDPGLDGYAADEMLACAARS
ncbi:SAM-dependent methyltransferase, partial [Streptomyces sp. NPDC020125]|uniref:SAM-dependent methyltransferase n=1 Tax=Streptomyces sp. NPDC020125 TaxID=3154593 RepID=UPI0033DC31F1